MGKYCKICGRKIRFFEPEYENGICEECYKIKLREEEEKKIEKLKRKKIEEERKREIEKQKKVQERLELEKKKKIEEQNKERKRNIILEFLKDKFSSSSMNMLFNIFDKDSNGYIGNSIKFMDAYQKADNSLLVEIMFQYLSNLKCFENDNKYNENNIIFNIEDIKKVFENENVLYNIIKKYIKRPDDEVYYELYPDIDEEFLEYLRNTVDSPKTLNTLKRVIKKFLQLCSDENIEKYIYTLLLTNKMNECTYLLSIDIKNEIAKVSGDDDVILNYMFLWIDIIFTYCLAYILCYLIALRQYTANVNPELEEIYEQLMSRFLKINYITDKIYDMYDSLYTDMSDTILKKGELGIILWLEYYDKISVPNNKESIIKEYQKYKEKFNNIDNEESSSKAIYELLSKMNIADVITGDSDADKEANNYYIVSNLLYDLLNELSAKEFFYISFHREKYYKAIEKNKKNAKKELMKKERERYLAGNFDKEDRMLEEEYSYENIKNGYEFEEYVANLYNKLGYKIEEVTKKSGDQGADIVAYKDGKKYVIQVKYYNSAVGNKAIQEVVASIKLYGANKSIVVTNNNFTSSAIELAKANNVELINGEKLNEMRKKIVNTTSNQIPESFIYIKNILKRAEEKLKGLDTVKNEDWLSDIFIAIGESYVEEEKFVDYTNNKKIEKFINAFFKYGNVNVGNFDIDLKENKEVYSDFIREGIFKYEVLKKMNEILNNNKLGNKEKDEKILEFAKSYVKEENNENNGLAKYMIINKLLNIDLEDDN